VLGYELAKTIHFISIIGIFISTGYTFASSQDDKSKAKKIADICQPVFGILIFVSAWELVSALNLHQNFPIWGKIKFSLWLLMAILGIVASKKKSSSKFLLGVIFILGCAASVVAVFKPGL